MSEKQNDRVCYSFSFKISDDKFGSTSHYFSYTSDVEIDETPHDTMRRVKEFVLLQARETFRQKKDSLPKATEAPPRALGDRPAPGVSHGHKNGLWPIPGGKFKGQTLQELGPDKVQNMIDYFNQAEKGPQGWCKKFVEMGNEYIKSMDLPEFDSKDDIPF